MPTPHTFVARLRWEGSTAGGYDAYSRAHQVETPPAVEHLRLSSDPAFGGDAHLINPEQLLVVAASSCQMLSYLASAARSRLHVRSYTDEAEAVMPDDDPPMRLTAIRLRPRITVARGANLPRAHRLVGKAHNQCYIANSLSTPVTVEASIVEASR